MELTEFQYLVNSYFYKKYKVGDKLNIYQQKLLDSIEMLVEEKMSKINRDYTIIGKITDYNATDNVYTVLHNDSSLTLKARAGLTLTVGDVVYIRVVQGNFSEKFIDCKKP